MLSKLLPGALLLLALTATPTFAGECEDGFSSCREDCLLEFGGSIRTEMKKAFDRCVKKCGKTQNVCLEREHDITSNQLEESAIKKPSNAESTEAPSRNEPPTRVEPAEEAPVERAAPPEKSTRSAVSDEPSAKKGVPEKQVRGERAAEPKAEPKVEERAEKPQKKFAEEDLRDDKPVSSSKPAKSSFKEESLDEAPAPKSKREEPKEEKKRPALDEDDLRNY